MGMAAILSYNPDCLNIFYSDILEMLHEIDFIQPCSFKFR